MKVIFSLIFCVCLLTSSVVMAVESSLDNFEYGSDVDLNNSYSDGSDSGQTITLTRSTDSVEGTYSMQCALTYDGTQDASAAISHTEASSIDMSAAAAIVKISVKGDAAFAGSGTMYIKFYDVDGEAIRFLNSPVLEQTGWTDMEIPLSAFEEDPWDGDPGGGTGIADRTQILSWAFYFQNYTTNVISPTIYIDDFKWDTEATPPSAISIDGVFTDWQASDQIDVIPNEVEAAESSDPDVLDIWVSNDDYYLYVSVLLANSIDADANTRHVDIFVDTDMDNLTGFSYGWWATGGDKRAYVYSSGGLGGGYEDYSGTGGGWGWTAAGSATAGSDFAWGAQSVSNDRLEFRISRSWLGDDAAGNQSRIVVSTEYNWGGVDYCPNSLGAQTYTYTYVEGITPSLPTYVINEISSASAPNVTDSTFDSIYASAGNSIATWMTDGEVAVSSPYSNTVAYVLTDMTKIYFGIQIGDPDTSTLTVESSNDTGTKWGVDSWEIAFAPNPFTVDGFNYYKFTGDSAGYYDDMYPDGTTSFNAASFQYGAYIIDGTTWAAEFSVDIADLPGMMTGTNAYGHIGIQAKNPDVNFAYPTRGSFSSRDLIWDFGATDVSEIEWSLYE